MKILSININKCPRLSLMIIAVVFASTTIQAESITINSFYPPPFGAYERIRLVPHSTSLPEPCEVGSLYTTPSGNLNSCISGNWVGFSGQWTQKNNNVYLTDNNPTNKVGIGTSDPKFKLHLENDGGIMAKGTFGSGATLPSPFGTSSFIWYPRKSALYIGYNDSKIPWDDSLIGNYSSVTGGQYNTASGIHSVVGGGMANSSTGTASIIAGGSVNIAAGTYSTVGGGHNNSSAGSYSSVGGGQ